MKVIKQFQTAFWNYEAKQSCSKKGIQLYAFAELIPVSKWNSYKQ